MFMRFQGSGIAHKATWDWNENLFHDAGQPVADLEEEKQAHALQVEARDGEKEVEHKDGDREEVFEEGMKNSRFGEMSWKHLTLKMVSTAMAMTRRPMTMTRMTPMQTELFLDEDIYACEG